MAFSELVDWKSLFRDRLQGASPLKTTLLKDASTRIQDVISIRGHPHVVFTKDYLVVVRNFSNSRGGDGICARVEYISLRQPGIEQITPRTPLDYRDECRKLVPFYGNHVLLILDQAIAVVSFDHRREENSGIEFARSFAIGRSRYAVHDNCVAFASYETSISAPGKKGLRVKIAEINENSPEDNRVSIQFRDFVVQASFWDPAWLRMTDDEVVLASVDECVHINRSDGSYTVNSYETDTTDSASVCSGCVAEAEETGTTESSGESFHMRATSRSRALFATNDGGRIMSEGATIHYATKVVFESYQNGVLEHRSMLRTVPSQSGFVWAVSGDCVVIADRRYVYVHDVRGNERVLQLRHGIQRSSQLKQALVHDEIPLVLVLTWYPNYAPFSNLVVICADTAIRDLLNRWLSALGPLRD